MYQMVTVYRDNERREGKIRKLNKDRNGDFTVTELDGSTTHIPSSAVYSINLTPIGEL
jgi:hypothetical protein